MSYEPYRSYSRVEKRPKLVRCVNGRNSASSTYKTSNRRQGDNDYDDYYYDPTYATQSAAKLTRRANFQTQRGARHGAQMNRQRAAQVLIAQGRSAPSRSGNR